MVYFIRLITKLNFFFFFGPKDEAWEERDTLDQWGHVEFTGQKKTRLCLVLDCLTPHDFSSKNADLINLQHYVIREKKLSEKEAIVIFYDIVRIVENLHKVHVLWTLKKPKDILIWVLVLTEVLSMEKFNSLIMR